MFPVDYHLHTGYTQDATGTLNDYCKRAQKLGMKEIAFTNHLILPKFQNIPGIEKSKVPEITIKLDQIQGHYKEIEIARKRFGIRIKFSMEIDYFEGYEREIDKIINNYPFDFVLGSTHFLDGFAIGDPGSAAEFFQNRDVSRAYVQYFLRLKKAIKSKLFDVIAHPDVIRKYAIQYSDIPFEEYKNQAESVVHSLIDNKIGIELNTFGYTHPVRDSYPSIEFLKICKDFGVKTVTVGSDAHSPSALGIGLEEGIKKLKNVGYNEITLFNKRKPRKLSIKVGER